MQIEIDSDELQLKLKLKQMWTTYIIRWHVHIIHIQLHCFDFHRFKIEEPNLIGESRKEFEWRKKMKQTTNRELVWFSSADNIVSISCLIWKIHFNANVCFVSNNENGSYYVFPIISAQLHWMHHMHISKKKSTTSRQNGDIIPFTQLMLRFR